MKRIFTACVPVLFFVHTAAQTPQPPQEVFCRFVLAFNERNFDGIYDAFSPVFQAQVDRAVCTGGLSHIFYTNGPVQTAAIAAQSAEEGVYYAVTDTGVFKVQLSIDNRQRIDGLRIQQLARSAPLPASLASLVFQSHGHR